MGAVLQRPVGGMTTPMNTRSVPLAEQIAELERERDFRATWFQKKVRSGAFTSESIATRMARLEAAIETLRALQATELVSPAGSLGTWPRR